MNFFQQILSSIYDPKFYKKIPKKSGRQAFGYYLLLSVLISIIYVLTLIAPLTASVGEIKDKFVPALVAYYPKELEITIKNGQVSTNVEEPYAIKLPKGKGTTEQTANLLVIDTKTPFTDEAFKTYNTVAVLTKDHIYYQDEKKGEIRGYTLEKVDNMTINQGVLRDFVKTLSPFISSLVPFLLIIGFFGLIAYHLFRLIHLLLIALIIFIIMKIFKPDLSFDASFKTALYAVTLAFLLEVILAATAPVWHMQGFPFMTTLITVIVAVLNYKSSTK